MQSYLECQIFPNDMSKGVFIFPIAKCSWQMNSRMQVALIVLQRELNKAIQQPEEARGIVNVGS